MERGSFNSHVRGFFLPRLTLRLPVLQVPSSCGHPTSKSASREPELDPETRIRTSLTAQKQEPGAQPGKKLCANEMSEKARPEGALSLVSRSPQHRMLNGLGFPSKQAMLKYQGVGWGEVRL